MVLEKVSNLSKFQLFQFRRVQLCQVNGPIVRRHPPTAGIHNDDAVRNGCQGLEVLSFLASKGVGLVDALHSWEPASCSRKRPAPPAELARPRLVSKLQKALIYAAPHNRPPIYVAEGDDPLPSNSRQWEGSFRIGGVYRWGNGYPIYDGLLERIRAHTLGDSLGPRADDDVRKQQCAKGKCG